MTTTDAEELSGLVADPLPLSAPSATKVGMDSKLLRILSKAVEELVLEWSQPEEPSCSCLDEWFLPGRHQAPRQHFSPLFPEVHDELTRSWNAPTPLASILLLHPPSLRSTALKKSGTRKRVSSLASLPAHGYWLEVKGHTSVQAV